MGRKWNRDSRYNKYRKDKKLWLDDFYTTYFYWYRFLQVADADPTRQVDWTKYKGWGGSKVISTTSFDEWWKEPQSKRKSVYDGKSHPVERWEILFGYSKPQKDGKVLRKWNTEPKFSTTTNSKRDDLRFPLMVYERLHKHYEHYRIAPDKQTQILRLRLEGLGLHKVAKQVNLSLSTIKKYLKDNAYGGKYKKTDWKTIGKEIKEIERRRVQRNKDRGIIIKTPKTIDLTEYRRRADEILDSVCRGYFPYPPIPEDITDAERRALQTDRTARVRGKGKKSWGHRWSRVPNHTAFPYNFVEPDPNYIPPKPEEEEIELTREELIEQQKEEKEITQLLEKSIKEHNKPRQEVTREERIKQVQIERKREQEQDRAERQQRREERETERMLGHYIEEWETK